MEKYSQFIKAEAQRLGFLFCGISKASFLEEEAPLLEKWLKNSYQGEMSYMENHFDKRLDPSLLVDDAKSVISLGLNYYTEANQSDPEAPKISMYAYGEDYHSVIKGKLKTLINRIQEEIGDVHGRAFVDSAPVLDKAWAKKAGLGWVGKHSNIINQQNGSYFFLAELIVDAELAYDIAPQADHCGTCTRCIDACPTDALSPYQIDATRCISYLTIELREAIPNEFKGKMDNWMFGCDVCQEVCPWNRFAEKHKEAAFEPHTELLALTKEDWQDLSYDVFDRVLGKSAAERAGFEGIKRSIRFLNED